MTMTLRQAWVGLRFLFVMTVLVGIAYPLAVWAVGRVAAGTADGSFVSDRSGAVVGSALIGQSFDGPRWFHPRPSAAGADGYDALSSGGSNLAADNPTLVDEVGKRKAAAADANGIPADRVPPDAVTASGSGLDPHISPEYAAQQIERVAKARGLDAAVVAQLVEANTAGRVLGIFGEPAVNVLTLNLALEDLR